MQSALLFSDEGVDILVTGQCLTFRDIEAVAYEAARFGKSGKYKHDIVEIRNQSRLRESAQDDKWSFCLTAGTLCLRIRRDNEPTTAPEPHTGLQGKGGACRQQRRSNAG